MHKFIAWLCLVADGALLLFMAGYVVWWPDLTETPWAGHPHVELPRVASYWEWHEQYDGVYYVTITKDGAVHADGVLEEEVAAYLEKMRGRGRKPTRGPGGKVLSRLNLVVRADRDAPWAAVHGILRRAGGAGLLRIRFLAQVDKDTWKPVVAHLSAYLPVEKNPSGTRYIDPGDPVDRSEEYVRIVGRIDRPAGTHFRDVVAALETFLEKGIEHVEFYSGGVRAEVR